MLKEEKLNQLYDKVINGTCLTTKELNACGINSNDINNLIKNKVIERVQKGFYIFLKIDDLVFYGKKLISLKEYNKAHACFLKCCQLDPNNKSACFRLFYEEINNNNYEDAFKYFDVIYKSDNPYYQKDYNFYLYLLNMITDIPDKYKEIPKNFQEEDLMLLEDDQRYDQISLHNQVRKSIFKGKINLSINQLVKIMKTHNSKKVQELLILKLLKEYQKKEKDKREMLANLIRLKKYQEIVDYLEKTKESRNLTQIEIYILKLINVIENINKDNLSVLKIKNSNSLSIYEAIDNNDYYQALNYSIDYIKKNNLEPKYSFLYLLLNDICSLINEKKNTRQEKEDTNQNEDLFTLILTYLMNKDYENAYNILVKYLEQINKLEYMFLIQDLIKISILENDMSYSKAMTELTYLTNNKFTLFISLYLQSFYLSLANDEYDKARIYLDIITNFYNLGLIDIKVNNLLEILELSESILINKQINMVDDIKTKKVDEPIKKEKVITKEKDPITNYFLSKYQELLTKKTVIILKKLKEDEEEKVLSLITKYLDVTSFVINQTGEKRIVLRYKYPKQEWINVKEIFQNASFYYGEGNYEEALKYYLELFKIDYVKPFVYARIGMIYIKLRKKTLAYDYLILATELSKNDKKKFDFYDFIKALKDEESEFKEQMIPSDDDLQDEIAKNNLHGYYDLSFNKIYEYILKTGLDLTTACQELGFTDEEINIITLIYAREYFIQGNDIKGEQFLSVVLKSKKKNNLVVNLLEEIQKRKKFYIHNKDEKTYQLSLNIKPKK